MNEPPVPFAGAFPLEVAGTTLHLRKGGEPMPLDVSWHIGPLHEHGLAFVHDADAHTDADADTDTPPPARYTLAGHVHPIVRLAVPGGTALRVPVFWRRRDTLVLPAFGRLTGGQPVRPAAGDQLLVAGAERVRAAAATSWKLLQHRPLHGLVLARTHGL